MNYILEINAFYQRQETNALSSNAANLWHTLMHINNRAGWRKSFTVAVSVLCSKTHLANSTFKRARIELRDKGYIRYQSRSGNQAAIYQIVSSEELKTEESGSEMVCKTKSRSKSIRNLDHKVGPLVKQNKTKLKITTTTEAIDFYRVNFGKVSPYILTEVAHFVNVTSEPLVLAAMKCALKRGNANWGYVQAILKSWVSKGFTTIEDTEAESLMFSKQQQFKKPKSRQHQREEVIPDWFHDRNKKRVVEKADSLVEEAKKREIRDMIARYADG